jgi:hypothetical protein
LREDVTTYACTYELRDGEAVVSTGRLLLEQAPTVGERLQLGDAHAQVEDVLAQGMHELRLVLRLL